MTTLEELEQKIQARFLKVNQPPHDEWYSTVSAVHSIYSTKQWKYSYTNVSDYLEKRWHNSCSRSTFFKLNIAGLVIKDLENTFIRDQLPSNTHICLCVYKVHVQQKKAYVEIWTKILDHFGERDNVVSKEISDLFVEPPPIVRPREETIPSPPPTATFQQSRMRAGNASEETARNVRPRISVEQRSMRPRTNVDYDETEEDPTDSEEDDDEVEKGSDRLAYDTEWNTSDNFVDAIHSFANNFGGIHLDPCTNPESPILSRFNYGRQPDESFIDALSLPRWGIAANDVEYEKGPEHWSKNVPFAYINPPFHGSTVVQNGKSSNTSPRLFIEKFIDEMEKGHLDTGLLFIPFHPADTYMSHLLKMNVCMCFLDKRVSWRNTDKAHEVLRGKRRAVVSRIPIVFILVNRNKEQPFKEEFIRLFKPFGYIVSHFD